MRASVLERAEKPAPDRTPVAGTAEAPDVLSMEGGCDMKGDMRECAVAAPTGRNLKERRDERGGNRVPMLKTRG